MSNVGFVVALSETEQLRRRAEWAENELRRIERETALMAIAKREEIAATEARVAAEAAAAAHAAELEEHRVAAWINHRVECALAAERPDDAMAALLSRDPKADIPKDLWPPGVSADDFAPAAALAAMPARDESVGGTALGRALAACGATI